jgi:hypothetical protein
MNHHVKIKKIAAQKIAAQKILNLKTLTSNPIPILLNIELQSEKVLLLANILILISKAKSAKPQ